MSSMIDPAKAAAPGLTRFDNKVDLSPFIGLQNENAWAVQKSLMFHNIGVFYTLVPKNACTSILSALASANGLTTKWFQSRNRIHNMQGRFNAFNDLERFHDDTFKIIAFRDPYKRFLSAFKNKIISRQSENYLCQQFFEQRIGKPPVEWRFSDIVKISDHFAHWALDQHFAPQWSFLFYDHYDLVIDADAPITSLDIGSQEIPIAWHNRKSRGNADEDLGDATVGEIRAFVDKTGKHPNMDSAKDIFRSCLMKDGNFDCDFRLYRALKRLPA
jgi:hypothetical protein